MRIARRPRLRGLYDKVSSVQALIVLEVGSGARLATGPACADHELHVVGWQLVASISVTRVAAHSSSSYELLRNLEGRGRIGHPTGNRSACVHVGASAEKLERPLRAHTCGGHAEEGSRCHGGCTGKGCECG